MWWIGNNRDDESVVAALDRLERLDGTTDERVPRGVPRGLIGYGATIRRGSRVPLLVVDERRDPRPALWIPGPGLLRGLVRRRLRRRDLPLPPGADNARGPNPTDTRRWSLIVELRLLLAAMSEQRDLDPGAELTDRGLAVPLHLADEVTRDIAARADLPDATLVSYWPRPTATSAQLRGIGRKPTASAGIHLDIASFSLLATAGHFDVPRSGPVFRCLRWPSRDRLLGTMRVRYDPQRPDPLVTVKVQGNIDLGLIELTSRWSERRQVQPEIPYDVREADVYRWHGAGSGLTAGEIVGPLRMIDVAGYPLARCWYLSGVSKRGDSGAAVVHRATGRVLGQIVGSRGGDAGG